MPIVKEKYSAHRISQLHLVLSADAEAGRPREYDIAVDELKVVRRTADPEQFFCHEDFMDQDTRHLSITLYEGSSKRNVRYVFSLKDDTEEKASLSGIEATITEKLEQKKKEWEYEQLQKENEKLKEERAEQDEFIDILKQGLNAEKQKKVSIKDNWGDLASRALEGIIRRNPQFLDGIPLLGQGLAGMIGQDNKRMQQVTSVQPDTSETKAEVSFEKKDVQKESPPEALNEEDKQILDYFKSMYNYFSEAEIEQILEIQQLFFDHRESIMSVLEFLKRKAKKAEATE